MGNRPDVPSFSTIIPYQLHIRRAVVEDDEVSARWLDAEMQAKPFHRKAVFALAAQLLHIRMKHEHQVG